jgi:hypothetical protein
MGRRRTMAAEERQRTAEEEGGAVDDGAAREGEGAPPHLADDDEVAGLREGEAAEEGPDGRRMEVAHCRGMVDSKATDELRPRCSPLGADASQESADGLPAEGEGFEGRGGDTWRGGLAHMRRALHGA